MGQILAKICDHSFLTVKVRALWLAGWQGQWGGDEMNVCNYFHCEGFQNFLPFCQLAGYHCVDNGNKSDPVTGQRGHRMFLWS